jgi:hypothetical protein
MSRQFLGNLVGDLENGVVVYGRVLVRPSFLRHCDKVVGGHRATAAAIHVLEEQESSKRNGTL